MRALVLLCLLHAALGQYAWDAPEDSSYTTKFTTAAPTGDPNLCVKDKASCGCCLMQTQLERLEWFFNTVFEHMNTYITKTKRMLDTFRANRSAFSVALNNNQGINCYGPFNNSMQIIYQHVFLNLGNGYQEQTGIFIVPLTGVYSLSFTIYAERQTACANLHINNRLVSELPENNGQDLQDSGTVIVTMKLQAGDQVTVMLPRGCALCDHNSHLNTFTGFLLYAE